MTSVFPSIPRRFRLALHKAASKIKILKARPAQGKTKLLITFGVLSSSCSFTIILYIFLGLNRFGSKVYKSLSKKSSLPAEDCKQGKGLVLVNLNDLWIFKQNYCTKIHKETSTQTPLHMLLKLFLFWTNKTFSYSLVLI